MILPNGIIKADQTEPRVTLLYGAQKTGKSAAIAALSRYMTKDNKPLALILDTQNGYSFLDAVRVSVPFDSSLLEKLKLLKEFLAEIRKNKGMYKIGIIDNLSDIDLWAYYLGTKNYMESPKGQKWNLDDKTGKRCWDVDSPDFTLVTELGNGYGWVYQRTAFASIILDFIQCFEKVILVGHIKEIFEEENSVKIKSSEIDITGKAKYSLAREVDAVAKFTASKDERFMNFTVANSLDGAGCRVMGLSDKNVLISKGIRDDKKKLIDIEYYWENIYPDTLKNCIKQ